MSKVQHGPDPNGCLREIHVLAQEVRGVHFGALRLYTRVRRPDGTGWAPRKSGPTGTKRTVLWMDKGLAATEDHAAALMAVTGLWRTNLIDETHVYLPSDESLRLMRSALRGGASSWVTSASRPLEMLLVKVQHRAQCANLVVGGGNLATVQAMRQQVESEVADHHGEETLELLEWARRVQMNKPSTKKCSCGKSDFATQELAELAVLKFAARSGKRPVRSYKCPVSGWYHLTSLLLEHR